MKNLHHIKSVHTFMIFSNAFNRFYHETKILSEENEDRKAGFIALLLITKRALEACIDMLGFEAPERM